MSAKIEQACGVDNGGIHAPHLAPQGRHEGLAEQVVFTLDHPVNADVLLTAWKRLLERHPALCQAPGTATEIDAGEAARAIPDWRDEPNDEARSLRLDALLRESRRQVADRVTRCLFHVALVRWDEHSWRCVCTLRQDLLDWRSFSMLLRELFNQYFALLHGTKAKVAEVASFPRFAERRDIAAHNVCDAGFWRDYLGDYTARESIDLPESGPARHADPYVVVQRRLKETLSEDIRRLRRTADVTMNNLMQAAWALLLSHYNGSNDVLFGILRSCRHSVGPDAADVPGCFNNVVPLRVQLTHQMSVLELVGQARDRYRQVRDHECTSLASIQDCLGRNDRDLFDTVLDFDLRDPMKALEELFSGQGLRDFRHYCSAMSRLHLQVYGEEQMLLRLKFREGETDTATAARILGHLENLLAAMARTPQAAAGALDYLNEEDKAPIRWPGARPVQDADESRTLHSLFEDRVAANPDAVALNCEDRSLTYSELNSAANRLAKRLRQAGAQPDSLVGLCMERSIDQVVAILGILKSGAGYLPLDPGYPAGRLEFMLHDADARLVVASGSARENLPDGDFETLEFDLSDAVAGESNPEPAGTAANLAYVIYTSGSTGNPKGVMVEHRNVVRLFEVCQDWLNADPEDVWTMFHSFGFDFSVWEIWGALLHGGRLEVVPLEIARSPEAFYDLVASRGVTVLNQTPSAFRQFMQANATRETPPSLRLVVFGGERLDFGELGEWLERNGDERPRLVNMYGITETTVHVTFRPIVREDAERCGVSPIGHPLPDLYVRLLDNEGRPVPPGVRGELCVGGAGVTRGYLNRPELTAQKFIPDPALPGSNARLYRSGDFARLMPDGELAYIGRQDDQVKIRGYRIDLGEVTAALQSAPGIAKAVVVARKVRGNARLIGYYVPEGGEAIESGRLREELASRLPPHMLPAVLLPLERMPVNVNNKIDVRSLPDPEEAATQSVPGDEMPRRGTERTLADIWAEVLACKGVGRNDDFFGLGGDSILATQVVARARDVGLHITPRDVFTHPVLSDLARIPDDARTFNEESELNTDARSILAPVQRWFFDQDFEKPDHWNQSRLFQLSPGTDIDVLEKALLAVVEHHAALRTCFVREDDGCWRRTTVQAREAMEFSRIELDHLSDSESREAMALITDDIQASLSLSSGLLVRAAHFSGNVEKGDRLLIVIHQLVVDAASWKILLEDIEAAYRALTTGKQPALPVPAASHGDWVGALLRRAQSPAVIGEFPYWERLLSEECDAPFSVSEDTPGRESEAVLRSLALEAPDTASLLGEANRAYGSNPRELLVAALSRAMAGQWPSCRRLRIDLLRDARMEGPNDIDVTRTVGWFSTLQPLVLKQDDGRNLARLICNVKDRIRSAPNHGSGWGLLRYLRSSGGSGLGLAGNQPASVLLDYRDGADRAVTGHILQQVFEDTGANCAPENRLSHPLTLAARLSDDRMVFEFRCSRDAIPPAELDAFVGRFVRAVSEILCHCRARDGAVRTPTDFPLARLSQRELDRFPVDLENVEDILPLSPIQRLYHALSGTDRDVGFDQWVFRLEGELDERHFARAWQALCRRHDALRTRFADEGLCEPHQVILRDAEFRLQCCDWRRLDGPAQEQRLDEFLGADRQQGVATTEAPMMRGTLIRLSADTWVLVWSHHQAIVDGWSWPVMAAELGEFHDAALENRDPVLAPAGSVRSYIAWLAGRDQSDYSRFWREHLGRRADPASLIAQGGSNSGRQARTREMKRHELKLSAELTENIQQLARRLKLTPSVVFQAAWALLIAGITKRFDVMLGVAFSGRTSGLPMPEQTVGSFVNDLPVRVQVRPTDRLDQWLADLRRLQADLNHYQNVSPLEVHEWTENPPGARLFDSLIVFQNYATRETATRWGKRILVRDFRADVRTNYPLTVAVTPGAAWRIDFHHDESAIGAATMAELSEKLYSVLRAFTGTPDIHVSTVLTHLADLRTESGCMTGEGAAGNGEVQDTATRPAASLNGSMPGPETVAGHEADGELEERIAGICRQVMGVREFGVEQNFFDAGAQSVSLIEIHQRLQKLLDRTFPIVKLFEHPSVRALSRYLGQGAGGSELAGGSQRGAQRRAMLQRRRQAHQAGSFKR